MTPSRPCPACGGALCAWRTVPCSEPALGAMRFVLERCIACGTAVTVGDPVPEAHEIGAYQAGTPRLYALARPVLAAFDAQRLRILQRAVPAGPSTAAGPSPPAVTSAPVLLDIGAGRGRFVAAAAAAGYRASGIEPSVRGVQAARALGVAVAQAGIEDAVVAPKSLDAATLWHVLEHLDDPRAALTRISGWLRPGGALLVGVPNLASVQARIGGERWFHLDVPRHRTHFTVQGLSTLLGSSGFRVRSTHHLLLEHNPYGFWQSLVSRWTRQPSYLYHLLKRNAPLRSRDLTITIAATALVPVAVLAEAAAGLARRGGTVAMLAIREE